MYNKLERPLLLEEKSACGVTVLLLLVLLECFHQISFGKMLPFDNK
jgi:hypothetical protein